MKVLHLPYNIASQISISVRALRSLGIDARGLARKSSPIQDDAGIETVAWIGRPKPVPRLVRGIKWRLKLVRAMAWADVLHWHWGDTTWKGLDLCIAAWLRKPRLVEFWGDDLRDPHVAARDNPFIARMYASYPELAIQGTKQAQAMFKRHGFEALIPGYELSDYLDPNIFPTYYHTRAGLMLDDYTPRFPDPHKQRPLLVHAPSNKSKKGTEVLEEVIRQLQRSYEFDFQLVHQMGRTDSLAAIAAGDLFLDQFTIGAEGLASHEAMALGKPVVCFIKDSLRKRYPASLPIVIADQHNLTSAIAALLQDGAHRRDLGVRGRQYVEEFHDARKIAAELIEIYQDVAAWTRSDSDPNTLTCSRHWRSSQAEGIGQTEAEHNV
jgi:glycosyltransferase involved in cell wall biosynthesis